MFVICLDVFFIESVEYSFLRIFITASVCFLQTTTNARISQYVLMVDSVLTQKEGLRVDAPRDGQGQHVL